MKSLDQLSNEAGLRCEIIAHFSLLDIEDQLRFCESLKILASEMLMSNMKKGE